MTELNRNYARELRKSRALAVALLIVAPVAYLFVAYLIQIGPRAGGEVDMLFYILLMVAVVQPAVTSLIERFHLSRYRAGGATRMSPGQLFTSISLIKLVFVESVYIYGLIVYIISGDMMRMLYFYPVGMVWSAVYWPRALAWEKCKRAIEAK